MLTNLYTIFIKTFTKMFQVITYETSRNQVSAGVTALDEI